MLVANVNGRIALVSPDGGRAVDVHHASAGRFGPDPGAVFEDWDTFCGWASSTELGDGRPFHHKNLGPPSPRPRQIFAVGLNYRDHAAEAGAAVPEEPNVLFTKWASCLTGPISTVELPAEGQTDWEVELVVVIGRHAHRVPEQQAWAYVAGVTVGQDLSERVLQNAGATPQFSLGKSLPGYGPTGPWLVTPDELGTPGALELGCVLNGEEVQKGSVSDMVFSVPTLISWLSRHVMLLPGDLVFTGTPAGVGLGRTPPRYLRAGDELVSYITGIGQLHQRFTAAFS